MRITLGLRGRTIAIVAATMMTAALAVTVASRAFFGRSVDRIEVNEARTALLRAWALVEDDMEQLDLLVRDWATWDDTWNFIATRDRAYIGANLAVDDFLDGLKLSALIILDAQGRTVYETAKDRRWLPELAAGYREARPSSAGGWSRVASAGDSLHIAAARPILRTDGSGERRGTLVMARLIDEVLLSRYSRLSGLSVRIRPRRGVPAEATLPEGRNPPIVISLERSTAEAVMPIPTYGSGAGAEISISKERDIYRYGALQLTIFIASVVLIIALVGMVAIALFEAVVLGRMRAMNGTLEALYATIGERDAAIREVHHRVKNNLQVISSLVSLQAGKAGASESSALFDIRRRVLTISFVHEELYLDREIERVDAERLFSRLASMVSDSYDVGARVRVDVECGRFPLDLEKAVSIGLVACEIVANSFRHAFPEGRHGAITLSAQAIGGGTLRLAISDDGVGIKDGYGKGLGLSLIETLARQIQAAYALERRPGGGTSFSMTAPGAVAE